MKTKINLPFTALITSLLVGIFAGIFAEKASAQTYHGQASVLMGDYIIPGFGEVSMPELGNQFHRVGVDAFYSLNKRETVFAGVTAHSWSRGNDMVLSASPLIKGRLRGDRMMMEFGVGPTLQHRGYALPGATLISRGEFRLGCEDSRSILLVDVRAEVGGRGIFYDQAVGLRHGKLEARLGVSSVSQGEYLQVNYFTCERYSIGLTYAWDRAMNTLLESQGFGDYHRRALGFQAAVHF